MIGTAPPRGIVSEAVERGAKALHQAAMPRGATPWQRHSHAFQGIYLERSGTVMAAGLDVDEMAGVLSGHDDAIAKAPHNGSSVWECRCGAELGVVPGYVDGERSHELDALLRVHQADSIRTHLLGGAA
jgi:hypothetical protein